MFCRIYVLLGTIIFNIINRKTIDQEARVLTSDIGTLELRYLSRTQELDLAYAQARGFVEPRELHFAQKVTTEKVCHSVRLMISKESFHVFILFLL